MAGADLTEAFLSEAGLSGAKMKNIIIGKLCKTLMLTRKRLYFIYLA